MRILVVEDDRKAARFLKQGLEEEGHLVDVAADGEEGAQLGHLNPYDLIVSDVQLPKKDGLQLSRELRREGVETPILMLTARDSIEDIVRGLDAGADDYMTKPFALDEFLSRVPALSWRPDPAIAGALRYEDLEMDPSQRLVTRAGHPIDLSPRGLRLLEHFLLHPEELITRTMLLQGVWGMSFDPETNVVDALMSNLRRKLEEGGRPRLIHPVRGAGYMLRSGEPGK